MSPLFTMNPVDLNPFGLAPGATRAVADGFWVLIEEGSHVSHARGEATFPEFGGVVFVTEVTYNLTVDDSMTVTASPSLPISFLLALERTLTAPTRITRPTVAHITRSGDVFHRDQAHRERRPVWGRLLELHTNRKGGQSTAVAE